MSDALKTSSGVERLIQRLREEGVTAGESEAKRVLGEAEKKAAEITAQAQRAADELLSKAREEIEKEQSAARAALHVALRDSVLDLRERIRTHFTLHVRQLIERELSDESFLKELILAVAGRAAPPRNQQIEVLLSQELPGKGAMPEGGISRERMDSFIISATREILREGAVIKHQGQKEGGIRIRLSGSDMQIDLTDRALSDLILRHLTPRFRELIEGAVS